MPDQVLIGLDAVIVAATDGAPRVRGAAEALCNVTGNPNQCAAAERPLRSPRSRCITP